MTEIFKAIGLMSGTSLDGVDAALIETDGKNHIKFLGGTYIEYDPEFRARLHKCAKEDVALNEVMRLEKTLTQKHAQAVSKLLRETNTISNHVKVVGFHGQTIRHIPNEGLTWQLANPQLLAELCKITVVSDFRRRDMAVGGQGAPLIPLYHKALFKDVNKPFTVLNIGGVGNITHFTKGGEVVAGDTGPGVGLLNAFCEKKLNKPFDADGKLAMQGKADEKLVDAILNSHEFFTRNLPRSADRYDFDNVDVSKLSNENALATLSLLSAKAVKHSLDHINANVGTLYITGGGANNPSIVNNLKMLFADVKNVSELNLRADYMEAECFAWLAVRKILGLDTAVPSTTGADVPTCGGVVA